MVRKVTLLVICLLPWACTPTNAQDQLRFESAWVRAMPPGSMMTAGFGRLINEGKSDLVIKSWTSDEFADVSLHRTVEEEGVSRMKSVPELNLAAGAELVLEPGGYHLMLMKPVDRESELVGIRIEAENGKQFEFQLPIERR